MKVIKSSPKTPLYHAKKLEKLLGIKRLYFKLEGKNKTGSFKDRSAAFLVSEAKKNNYDCVTVGTCGNFGVAIAKYCTDFNIHCNIFIPKQYKNQSIRNRILQGKKVSLNFIEGTYEDAVGKSITFAKENHCFDANPVGSSAKIAIKAYEEIAEEIITQLKYIPDYIWISVGNGTGLTGVFQGFNTYSQKPKICAVSSLGNNAIIESIDKGYPTELSPTTLNESVVNEPLLNWRSFQVYEAFRAITTTNGLAVGVSDEEMIEANDILLKYENIFTKPASASAYAGLVKLINILDLKKTYVIILTS